MTDQIEEMREKVLAVLRRNDVLRTVLKETILNEQVLIISRPHPGVDRPD